MRDTQTTQRLPLRFVTFLAGVIGLMAVLFLGTNVAREVVRMDRNLAENATFSLSQSEIEFLEFTNVLSGPAPDLNALRLRYDIFYGRIRTIAAASAYEILRNDAEFMGELEEILSFLEQSVVLIDRSDPDLRADLEQLRALAENVRGCVRQIAIIGLDRFARLSDVQRNNIATTTTQLGIAIVTLIAGLGLTLLFLDRSNKRAMRRGRDLELSAARMNTIIKTAIDGVIVTDETYRIIEFSPAAEVIFNVPASDAVGTLIFDFIDVMPEVDHAPDAEPARNDILKTPVRMQRSAYRKNGVVFPAEVALQRAATSDGYIYIAFVRDISPQVAAEAALVAARDTALANEQIKTDFMATMSHEIRTPLNGLLGNMDLMRDTSLNAAQQTYLKNMDTSGRMLMRHVSDVLDITQYESGKMSISLQPTHLPTLVEDIVASQMGLAVAQGTTLTWGWDGPAAEWINCDPDRVQHILMNLIGNAVKFTKDGKVTVTLSRYDAERQPHVLFQIEDTGPGISAELLPQVFDDFVTGNTTNNRNFSGTGLGLSIAKRFATGLGGTVGVESAPGVGSTFWLDLPVMLATAPVASADDRTLPPVAVQDILVIEDNAINRMVTREMLEADGHRVTEATNGAEGVARAAQHAFDLILMDINMPVLDGPAAAQQIKTSNGPSACSPIVALTANVVPDDAAGFLSSGMVATLTKPLTRFALRSLLRDLTTDVYVAPGDVLDHAHLAETQEVLSPEAFATATERFVTQITQFIDTLAQTAQLELSAQADRAHQMAGTAAMFGATALATSLTEFETAAREGNLLRVHRYRSALPRVWTATRAAFDEISARTRFSA